MADSGQRRSMPLQTDGYRSRIVGAASIVLILAAIAAIIALAAIWANSRSTEPEIPPPIVQPAPTVPPSPTSTAEATEESTATAESTTESMPLESEPGPTSTPTPSPTDTPIPTPTRTPTPTPTPTPTDTPTPTATPTIPIRLEAEARLTLIDLGIKQDEVTVVSVQETEWHDLALGCGSPDGDNPAMRVKGWIMILEHEGRMWTFHIAETDDGGVVVDCTDVPEVEENLVNLVEEFDLDKSERIVFSAGSTDGGYTAYAVVEEPREIVRFVQTLNIDIAIGDSEPCETAYRLDFHVEGESQTLDFFCKKDWFRIGGDQPLWNGKQGAMPEKILDLIAPFLSGRPLPGLPPSP